MTARLANMARLKRLAIAFARDRRGAAALDMALVGMPFILLVLAIMQMGAYYMAQVTLDAGTVKTAESLRAIFSTGAAPATLTTAQLKSAIVAGSATGISSNASACASPAPCLIVEVQPLANLDSGAVAITDGLTNYGSAWTPLVLRAKYTFSTFVPGFPANWSVVASAIVRRQGQ